MGYSRSKLEVTVGFLWEVQTKTAKKKDYFTKNIFSPTFFKINTSNFQEMFPRIFRKFYWKEFKKKPEKRKFQKKNLQKNYRFFF